MKTDLRKTFKIGDVIMFERYKTPPNNPDYIVVVVEEFKLIVIGATIGVIGQEFESRGVKFRVTKSGQRGMHLILKSKYKVPKDLVSVCEVKKEVGHGDYHNAEDNSAIEDAAEEAADRATFKIRKYF